MNPSWLVWCDLARTTCGGLGELEYQEHAEGSEGRAGKGWAGGGWYKVVFVCIQQD